MWKAPQIKFMGEYQQILLDTITCQQSWKMNTVNAEDMGCVYRNKANFNQLILLLVLLELEKFCWKTLLPALIKKIPFEKKTASMISVVFTTSFLLTYFLDTIIPRNLTEQI